MLYIFLLTLSLFSSVDFRLGSLRKSTLSIEYNWAFLSFIFFSVVKQLCWEKKLHNIHYADDFRLVNGQLLRIFQFFETA